MKVMHRPVALANFQPIGLGDGGLQISMGRNHRLLERIAFRQLCCDGRRQRATGTVR